MSIQSIIPQSQHTLTMFSRYTVRESTSATIVCNPEVSRDSLMDRHAMGAVSAQAPSVPASLGNGDVHTVVASKVCPRPRARRAGYKMSFAGEE